jgi:hypothetical protein
MKTRKAKELEVKTSYFCNQLVVEIYRNGTLDVIDFFDLRVRKCAELLGGVVLS